MLATRFESEHGWVIGYLEGYGPDRGGSSERSGNIRLNQESISCLAAITSAATVLYRMSEDGNGAGIRGISSGKSKIWQRTAWKEVMLLGQNVNSYGKTLEEPMTFAELLRGSGKDRRPGTNPLYDVPSEGSVR